MFRTNTLYVYRTKPGDVFLDNIQIQALVISYTTNWAFATNGTTVTTNVMVTSTTNISGNLLLNGDFEASGNPVK